MEFNGFLPSIHHFCHLILILASLAMNALLILPISLVLLILHVSNILGVILVLHV